MGVEIERKFLVKSDTWKKESGKGKAIQQGYLNSASERTVRVRVYGDLGFLTVKGKNENLSRKEFEYEVPLEEAQAMLELCEKPIIEKIRYVVLVGNKTWEIDVFKGENEGLLVAEVELNSEKETFEVPEWLGQEVSLDSRYYNSALILHPFKKWSTSN